MHEIIGKGLVTMFAYSNTLLARHGGYYAPEIKKAPIARSLFLKFNPGGDLRSRAVTRAVSSAQQGLTSVFGMGTGVTLAIRPPGNWKSKLGSRKLARSFDEQLREVG